MSPLITIGLALAAGLAGVGFGYYLRWVIAAGKKGSMELEIKQMMLEAKEKAKKIEEATDKKLEGRKQEVEKELKEKQEFAKKSEARILDREAFLDMDHLHDSVGFNMGVQLHALGGWRRRADQSVILAGHIHQRDERRAGFSVCTCATRI